MKPESWFNLAFDSWLLGLDSAAVIGLRSAKLAEGGSAAANEAMLMIGEKVEAIQALQWQAMTGQLGATPGTASRKAVAHYRRKVRANRRRLSR